MTDAEFDAIATRTGICRDLNGYIMLSASERDALVALARQARQWQPIETAPKDGTSVLLLHPVSFLQSNTVGWFAAGLWRDKATLDLKPTHWQPLPAPPTPEAP